MILNPNVIKKKSSEMEFFCVKESYGIDTKTLGIKNFFIFLKKIVPFYYFLSYYI